MTQSSLKLKTYFATTVEAAVELARRELGPEAMLVNSRRSPDEVRHLGNYEVIFATGAPPEPRGTKPALIRKAVYPSLPQAGGDTELQLEEIRHQLAGLRQSLGTSHADTTALMVMPSESSTLRRLLEARGVDASVCRDLLHTLHRLDPPPVGKEQYRQALYAAMEAKLTTDSTVGTEGSSRAILALVGPPGRGKSTTLVKFAVRMGLARRIPVRILSLDCHRVGAGEQMRSFSTILGVPFHACGSVAELDHHLSTTWGSEARTPGLTLIDTSGYGPLDLADSAELAAYFSANPQINVHLVLRADTNSADGLLMVRRYSPFGVSKIIFTGTDEVESYGSAFTIAVQSGLPLSFLGSGQSIPEDLEPAVSAEFVRLVVEGQHAAVPTAA